MSWSDQRIMSELGQSTIPPVEEFLNDFFELKKENKELRNENEELKEQIKQMTIEDDDLTETSYSI